MKLDKPVTLQRPPYTDHTDKVVTPGPTIHEDLKITFYDQEYVKVLGAQIEGIPGHMTLAFGPTYDALGDDRSLSMMQAKVKEQFGDDPQAFLQNLFPRTLESDPDGPGSILSGMISAMGIKSTPNCSCRKHAIEMNTNGPDWCEENLGTILEWLNEEAKKRNLPFVRTVAKLIVQRAVKKSRRILAKKAKQ